MPVQTLEMQTSPPALEIRLFGPMEVSVAGRPLPPLRSRSERWLLALLALRHGRATERSWLAATLWPDSTEERGLFYLRRALTDLRRALGAEEGRLRIIAPHGLRLDLSGAACDLVAFDRAAAGRAEGAWADAVALYRGPLLEGCLEEWALAERTVREQALQTILGGLAERAEAVENWDGAAHWLRRLMLADPAREDAQRRLMGCLAAQGDYVGLVQAYRAFRLYLHHELQSRPTPETVALYERLRAQGRQAQPIRHASSALPGAGGDTPVEPDRMQTDIFESVGGAMPLDSPFYVTRPADGQFRDAVARRDSIVLVKGPRQVGKTSLLARGLQAARASGARVMHTDFQELNTEDLASADALLRALAASLADSLGLDASPGAGWDPELGANMNMSRFIRKEVLGEGMEPMVWGLDEVDRLFGCAFGSEVFGLFRSWHNRRALEPAGPWSRLTLALAYSTEAHLFITDLNQSPFNVGTRLTLEDFTPDQAADLNVRYGSPLKTPAEQSRFWSLVGGHPYLVRRGLDGMVTRGGGIASLEAQAGTDEGVFAGHLHRLLHALTQDKSLAASVHDLLRGETHPTQENFLRLRSGGVLTGATPHDARFRCRLYADFIADRLA